MGKMQIINLSLLNEQEKSVLDHIVNKHYGRISKIVDNFDSIILHIKEFKLSKNQKEGSKKKRKNYSFILRVVYGKNVFESSNDSWDLDKALNEVFQKVEKEIEHKFRESF